MIRRLFRIAVAAFCLLSLLAAAGVSWLWWECRHGRGYMADASILGTYAMAESRLGDRTGVLVVTGWPGPSAFHGWTQHANYVAED